MSEPTNQPPPRRDASEAEIVAFVRSVDVRAPDEVHRRVQALIEERSPGRRRLRSARGRERRGALHAPRLGWRLGGALALVAVGLVALLGLPGGGSTAFSLRQASALTLAPAQTGAPSEDSMHPRQLTRSIDGVSFPYWEDSIGWRSTGVRVDRLDGRSVTTVFYANGRGWRVGYAIVGGSPAPRVVGGSVSWRAGVAYRLTREGGVRVVTWERDGHLCVIAGRGVSADALLHLASSDAS
jgi:hypothetical protein